MDSGRAGGSLVPADACSAVLPPSTPSSAPGGQPVPALEGPLQYERREAVPVPVHLSPTGERAQQAPVVALSSGHHNARQNPVFSSLAPREQCDLSCVCLEVFSAAVWIKRVCRTGKQQQKKIPAVYTNKSAHIRQRSSR